MLGMIRVQIFQPLISKLFRNLKVYNSQKKAYCPILKSQFSIRECKRFLSTIILNKMASSSSKNSISTTAFDVEPTGNSGRNTNLSRCIPDLHPSRREHTYQGIPPTQESTSKTRTQFFNRGTDVTLYSLERHCYFDTNYARRYYSTNQTACIRRQASLPEQSYLSNMCLFSDDRSSSAGTSYNARRRKRNGTKDNDKIESYRRWIPTEIGQHLASTKTTELNGLVFKIMGYNVLAQELLTEHSYLYKNHKPAALFWEKRWANLLREIKEHNADIICLQEVQESHLQKYYNAFNKLGYGSLYKKRIGYRDDGCAIYYRKSMFMLVEHIMVNYLQPDISLLDKGNVAIIAKFAPLVNPDTEFVVATTHLLYNPRRQDIRVAQTQVLLAELDRMAYNKTVNGNSEYLPVILTGDFNSQPTSAVHELIATGQLNYEFLTNRTLVNAEHSSSLVNLTGKTLLPSKLRITDQCQHLDLLASRAVGAQMSRAQEETAIQLKTDQKLNFEYRIDFPKNKSLFSTGRLSHTLNLNSVSSYIVGNDKEGTTCQETWITVDYIFYSGTEKKDRNVKLKLLEKYSVPTTRNLKNKTIPNFALGSDHLALVSKFKIDF